MEVSGLIGAVVMLILYLILFAFSIAIYVLQGFGVMKMAKSCGLPNPWMAFVPFANAYLLGQLAEQNPTPGKKSLPWRHIALIGLIVLTLVTLAFVVVMVIEMVGVISINGAYTEYDAMQMVGSLLGVTSVLSLISTVYSIAIYIILWKIYSLFAPNYAVIFLVLSILTNLGPIFLFLLRNNTPTNRPGPGGEPWM